MATSLKNKNLLIVHALDHYLYEYLFKLTPFLKKKGFKVSVLVFDEKIFAQYKSIGIAAEYFPKYVRLAYKLNRFVILRPVAVVLVLIEPPREFISELLLLAIIKREGLGSSGSNSRGLLTSCSD